MDLEVRQVAAMVSLNQQCKNKNDHLQLQAISETEFRLISNNFSGLSSPETLFSTPPLNSQNCFWKIVRSAGCDQIVFAFAHCLQSLVLRNFALLHNSQKVINIFVVNSTGMNVSNSKMFHEPHILVPKDISHLDVDINIPLYSSYSNMERMRNEVQFGRACREINRGIPEQQSTEQRTADHKKFIPHWWVCVVTANHKMFHIDLCGPAYEIFDYESNVFNLTTKRFDEAPVHIFETEKYMLVSLSKHGFDHKFSMLQSIFPGLIRGYPSNLHFSGVEFGSQVSLTPLETFLNRKNSSLIPTEASDLSNKIGNYFLLNAPNDIAVLTHNLLTSNLNNKIGRITHQGISFSESADARIGVLLEGDIDSVRIRPKNLVLYPSLCHKQFLSLKEVKHEVNELDNCAFIRLAKVTITGLTSEEGARINGQEGTIVNGPLEPLEPHQRVQDYRYSVELNLNKVRKSISVKNLVLAKKIYYEDPSRFSEEKLAYFKTDPIAQEFLFRSMSGNAGFAYLADPKYRKPFSVFVDLKLSGKDGKIDALEAEKWIEMLRIAEHPKGETLRQLVLKLRGGCSQEYVDEVLADEDVSTFYDTLTNLGLLSRPRRA